ncbi:ABC-type multidrug transport system, ATPase and permease component [Geosmithia morbida]|uniref:ABC-type multidrug transport system, ATPase and permease component n=1 Tax=Geosmithia morbida TaxID=1094350 RepID=A0A9P4YP40_9HYPO|nr:ABC-type multidrug transport system, ATPase and permease component [Geosmithia morbida]KAF4120533.1 ABC-type multidrug transport system, ATPase and permease component [Geosmithia morbida]
MPGSPDRESQQRQQQQQQQQLDPADDLAAVIEPTYSRDETRPGNDALSDVDRQYEKIECRDSASSSLSHPKEDSVVDQTRPVTAPLTSVVTGASHASDTSAATRQQTNSSQKLAKKSWYSRLNPLRWGKTPPIPGERAVSREYGANILSLITFEWMTPLMVAGYKRQLHQRDIWAINPDRAVEPLTEKFRASFKRRVARGDKHPLFMALHETFFFEFWLGASLASFVAIAQVLAPFTLRYLIQFATDAWLAQHSDQPSPPIKNGIGFALGITAMMVFQSFGVNHFIYRGMMMGGQSRGILIGLIYEKAMLISARAKAGGNPKEMTRPDSREGETGKKAKDRKKPVRPEEDVAGWGNGRITNLMSVDTYRIDQASALIHMLWSSPISIALTLALLIVNLSYNALAGFGLIIVAAPLLAFAIRRLLVRRKSINKITDQRVSLTQEIIQSVRFVKFFGWEQSFMKRLGEYRSREIHSIQVLLAIRNAINAIGVAMPIFASMLSFISYSLTNPGLRPAEIFSSLALFNTLRVPLNILPLVLGQAIDAWSSMGRIEKFFMEEDEQEAFEHVESLPNAIELHNANFTWEQAAAQETEGDDKKAGKKSAGNGAINANKITGISTAGDDATSILASEPEPFKLSDINLDVSRNELIAVIGTVGSGKSSLLSALAGDMRKTSGEVILGASRAFCPQYAWIQNTSVRNNILFGKEYDRAWYNEVVRAAALEADMDMLPNGDQTEIGERGITISGGQKQRLNIARAIYFDADIILMDDPLSAVDAHVGRHIFDNAILGLLGNKCRVLATHQLWVLNRCDRIVWMDNGKIHAVGTFDQLMSEHASFRTLMETTDLGEKKKKKVGGDDEDEDEEAENKDVPPGKRKKNKAQGLMQQEEKAESSVPWSVYFDFVRASGSLFNAVVVFVFLLMAQGSNIMTGLWLSYWTSDEFGLTRDTYIGIYTGLAVLQAVIMYLFSVSLSIMGTRASKKMLAEAVRRVLRAPMSFFDTTPLGRITNRFSRDVDVMDNNLTEAMRMYLFTLVSVTGIFALIIAYFHWFAVALVPLYCLFILAASYYRASAREVKRFESVLRSNVFAKFGEGLTGVASIKAYGLRQSFVDSLRKSIDDMNAAYYLTFSNQRWLSIRVDMIGNLLVLVVGVLVVTSRFDVNPSISSLVLSYILAIVQMMQFGVRQLAEVENGMNAVERLRHYGTQLEEEAPLHTVEVRPSWPDKGEIVFRDVEMRYRENLPLVLKGLSMHVRGGERIGVVGRTGAGKSSIMSTLFRLVEISAGSITIDGLDISTMGLHDLRSRLAIIPQDPTLFRGTVRTNLDPFDEHTDLELWSALRQADLVPADAGPETTTAAPTGEKDIAAATATTDGNNDPSPSRIGLDTAVEEDGLNFSLGQRQLMALARALVRGSRIIVCDEATSSVDMETDAKIQNTIANGFRGRTLLCIAHRLRTIVGYDRICVMDAGRIAELDTPLELWKKEDGIFRSMCDRSGIRLEDIRGAREAMLEGGSV